MKGRSPHPQSASATRKVMDEIPEISPMQRLKYLEHFSGEYLDQLHENTEDRRAFLNWVKNLAESGAIAVVWSGMDCDCSAYENVVHIVSDLDEDREGNRYPSLVAAVDAHIDHKFEWADGPCSFCIMAPSDASELRQSHRDLALEAYENGHPHYISY